MAGGLPRAQEDRHDADGRRKDIMGEFPIQGWLRALGWLTTLTMGMPSIGLTSQWFL